MAILKKSKAVIQQEEETPSNAKSGIEKNIGKKIKLLRQLKGFSQSDIATHLGITFQQFQKYESGKNRIPITRLMTLASIFGVNMNVFFENSINVLFEDMTTTTSSKNTVKEESSDLEYSNNKEAVSSSSAKEIESLINSFKNIQDEDAKKHIAMLIKSLANQS